MKTLKLIALATAAAVPALAAFSATGPGPLHSLAELSAEERSQKTAELSEKERNNVFAELSAEERGQKTAELSEKERNNVFAELSAEERKPGIA